MGSTIDLYLEIIISVEGVEHSQSILIKNCENSWRLLKGYDFSIVISGCERKRKTIFWKWDNPDNIGGTVVNVLEEGKEQKKPDVSIYRPKKRELEDNNFISLVCVASNFFPEHVKIRWFVNSEERINLYEPVPQKNADDSYSTSKRLTLTREEYFNPDTTFRCVAAFLDGTLEASEEIKGETDCGVSKEFYTMYINQGKISYIMVLCKSGLYALVVLVLVWRKKVIAHSY